MSKDVREIGYARCKACDTQFYPSWRDDIKPCGTRVKRFEDLCNVCLSSALRMAGTDPVVGISDKTGELLSPYAWSPHGGEKEFIEGFIADKVGVSGDIWKEDPYLEYGEGAMGDFNYFDRYE